MTTASDQEMFSSGRIFVSYVLAGYARSKEVQEFLLAVNYFNIRKKGGPVVCTRYA